MKNKLNNSIIYIIIVVSTIVIYLATSCSKNEDSDFKTSSTNEFNSGDKDFNNDIDKQISFFWGEYHKNETEKNIFHDIWKYLIAHAGVTMFGDCGLNLPCGKCPGLCLLTLSSNNAFIPVEDNYQIPKNDYENGDRLIQLALLNDTIMEINIVNSDIVYNDSLYIFNDFNIGINASAIFEKDSIIVKHGTYPVTYSYSAHGNALLNVVSY